MRLSSSTFAGAMHPASKQAPSAQPAQFNPNPSALTDTATFSNKVHQNQSLFAGKTKKTDKYLDKLRKQRDFLLKHAKYTDKEIKAAMVDRGGGQQRYRAIRDFLLPRLPADKRAAYEAIKGEVPTTNNNQQSAASSRAPEPVPTKQRLHPLDGFDLQNAETPSSTIDHPHQSHSIYLNLQANNSRTLVGTIVYDGIHWKKKVRLGNRHTPGTYQPLP
jgi:hypothetical protein